MLDANKKRDIAERVRQLEADMLKAHEYLKTSEHSSWHKFQPLFNQKLSDGKAIPPHKDWVRNVFIPNLEKALNEAEKQLNRGV